jgi:hypothetical protein
VPETKDDCAGEGQQQFTELDWSLTLNIWLKLRRNCSRFIKFKYNTGSVTYQGVGFSFQWPIISPRLFHMALLDKVALGQVPLGELRFSLPNVIPPMTHIHPSSGANTIGPFKGSLLRDSLSPHYD